MYVRLRKLAEGYPMFIPILLLLVCLAGVWFYTDRASNIDTTGIQRTTDEVRNAQQYNQRAIEDNRRTRTAIERSQDVNDRIERTITRIDELNQRTEGAIINSQEHIRAAREKAINAKRIIGEGECILRHADERTQKNQDATKKQ